MIVLSARGWDAAQVAELLGYDPVTVRGWIGRYQRDGVAGLGDRPRSGRPRLGSPKLTRRILRLLAQPKAWTVGRLWRRLGRPAMSLPTLHRRVRQVACWRRSRLVARGDPDRDQTLASLRQAIAALPKGTVVLAEDETLPVPAALGALDLDPQRQRPAGHDPGTNRRRSVFGALDVRTGRFCYQVCRKAVSATFIAFLEQLPRVYPAAPVVAVICDNARYHRSKLVQQWLAAQPRLLVLRGARSSPHDPVERIWGALKAWLANTPTLTIQGRVRQVHAFFRDRSPTQLLATAAPHSSPWLPQGYGQDFWKAAYDLVRDWG